MNGNDLPRLQVPMSVVRLTCRQISKSPTFHVRGTMADKCKIVYNYELTFSLPSVKGPLYFRLVKLWVVPVSAL